VKISVTIRIPEDLKEKIDSLAEKEKRTKSQVFENLLEEGLKKHK